MHPNDEIRKIFLETLRAEILKIPNLPVISEDTTKQRAKKDEKEGTFIHIDNAHSRKLCFTVFYKRTLSKIQPD